MSDNRFRFETTVEYAKKKLGIPDDVMVQGVRFDPSRNLLTFWVATDSDKYGTTLEGQESTIFLHMSGCSCGCGPEGKYVRSCGCSCVELSKQCSDDLCQCMIPEDQEVCWGCEKEK